MSMKLRVFLSMLIVFTAGYALGGILFGLYWRDIPAINTNGLLLGLGFPFFLAMLYQWWALFTALYREEKRIRKIRKTPGSPYWFRMGP